MADLGWPAVAHLAEKGHSLYLLGNPQGVAAQAAERLKAAMPGVRILGTHHGFFQKTGPENDAVIAEINHLQPDVLMVGLGMPMEQRWILDNYARVDTRVFWTVGAAFQYWAGVIPRCPGGWGNMGWNGSSGCCWSPGAWPSGTCGATPYFCLRSCRNAGGGPGLPSPPR